jgi:hypothetical protein
MHHESFCLKLVRLHSAYTKTRVYTEYIFKLKRFSIYVYIIFSRSVFLIYRSITSYRDRDKKITRDNVSETILKVPHT